LWNLRNQRLQLLCVTAANAGLDAACRFVEFEGWLTTRAEQDYPVNEADWLAASTANEALEAAFPAANIPAIAPGAALAFDLPIMVAVIAAVFVLKFALMYLTMLRLPSYSIE
jgi:hypothetical protein